MKTERIKYLRAMTGPALILGAAFLSSCSTLSLLKNDVRSMNRDMTIAGSVAGSGGKRVKVLVFKKNPGDENFDVADSASPNQMGDFAFLLPKNHYFLAAMEDGDVKPHPNRLIKLYGGRLPTEISTVKSADSEKVILNFSRMLDQKNSTARNLNQVLEKWQPAENSSGGAIPIACGDLASLDDATFDPAAGEKGLWAPVTSAKHNGLGIYFLTPYDAGKIPVIFVHGIGGTPRSWKPIVESLDRRRYQAWVYNYPSGIPLDRAAMGLASLTDRLRQHYHFKHLHVVAHSMGGLVARRAVQIIGNEQKADYLSSLTTISTPWNGIPFAAVGTVGLSTPIPCWYDLRPNSKFIRKILDEPLPVPHLLISTEKSRFKFTLPRRNDGSVSVESQLDRRALAAATSSVMVFEDHGKVLEVSETKQAVKSFLRSVE